MAEEEAYQASDHIQVNHLGAGAQDVIRGQTAIVTGLRTSPMLCAYRQECLLGALKFMHECIPLDQHSVERIDRNGSGNALLHLGEKEIGALIGIVPRHPEIQAHMAN